MSPDTLFPYCNYIAMLGWILLLLSPLIKQVEFVVQRAIIPVLLAIIYAYLIIAYFGDSAGDFGSLAGVMQLFDNPHAVLAGWVHYLAFDLWVGCWEMGDAKKHHIHFLWLIPCFFFTFMFGPIGLLLYLVIRAIKTKKLFGNDNFRFSQGT